jgi:hypothetical protein
VTRRAVAQSILLWISGTGLGTQICDMDLSHLLLCPVRTKPVESIVPLSVTTRRKQQKKKKARKYFLKFKRPINNLITIF